MGCAQTLAGGCFYINIAALNHLVSAQSLQAHPSRTSDSSSCWMNGVSDLERLVLGSDHTFGCALSLTEELLVLH